MIGLRIHHRTAYRYKAAIRLAPHRLLLRPREGYDHQLTSHTLTVTPSATVTWAQDVMGNAVATATFEAPSDTLVIDSVAGVELRAVAYPVFTIAASAIAFPFRYADHEMIDLGALQTPQYPEEWDRLRAWTRGFVASDPTDTLCLLKDINVGVAGAGLYQAREDEGTQSPVETLTRRQGSCRDFATLFVEAVRGLGFGARIISGYLHDPTRTVLGSTESGSTHAWAEVFLPGAGWVSFDPTNGSVGGANLVPVAVAREIGQTMPVVGAFIGAPDALLDMSVAVRVTARE